MTVQLTVYDGAGVVGGNKILLEADGNNLFFDFGTTYAVREEFFEEYLKPRSPRGLLDLVTMGLLPPLLGLYRPDLDLLDGSVRQRLQRHPRCREVWADGVLLSHAHLDHSGYISFLRNEIPVYASTMTAFIAKAMQDSGQTDFEKEVCYLTAREEKGDGLLGTTDYRRVPYQQRPFVVLDEPTVPAEAQTFWETSPASRQLSCKALQKGQKVGSLGVRCFPVDHSVFGASAFAVETSIGWLVYTGDLRLHGKMGGLTGKFAEAAAALRPYALICEGTRIASGETSTEEEVFHRSLEVAKAARGLVIADFGPRNIERLLIFRDIARQTSRRLAILPRDAYLLRAMRLCSPAVPSISDDDALCVYADLKARRDKWETEVLDTYGAKLVNHWEVQRHQDGYILCFSFWDINELIDIEPRPGGIYIYSSSEAYTEEQRIDLQRLRRWLDHFGFEFVGDPAKGEHGFHASGHISAPDLLWLIRTINPKVVVPVHTPKPELFREHLYRDFEVPLPQRGEAIGLG